MPIAAAGTNSGTDSPGIQGDEGDLFAEYYDRLRRLVARRVRTSPEAIDETCAFAWVQFIRHQSDRGRNWRSWLVPVAEREAWRLHAGDVAEPRAGDAGAATYPAVAWRRAALAVDDYRRDYGVKGGDQPLGARPTEERAMRRHDLTERVVERARSSPVAPAAQERESLRCPCGAPGPSNETGAGTELAGSLRTMRPEPHADRHIE
jgi:hypothetical protein